MDKEVPTNWTPLVSTEEQKEEQKEEQEEVPKEEKMYDAEYIEMANTESQTEWEAASIWSADL